MNDLLKCDMQRYSSRRELPRFQKYYRLCGGKKGFLYILYRVLFRKYKSKNHIELSRECEIGKGLYIGHPYGITINPAAKIGCNCNIHKGVTIGQENRGKRKGTPVIGNDVWIGINSTIVGNITIGDDVLIAANTFVNCDIPNHSIVFGSPCIIKTKPDCNVTEGYINRKCIV